MASVTLRLPEPFQEPLARLLRLSPASKEQLVAAMAEFEPTLVLADLAESIGEATNLPESDAHGIAGLLSSLSTQCARLSDRHEFSLEDSINSVCESARATGREDLQGSDADWESTRGLLIRLLSHEGGLTTSSKAMDILYQFERLMTDARVFSDVRPVFGADPAKGPDAVILAHTLSLDFFDTSSNDYRSFQLIMDSEDVRVLQRLLERALSKERSLTKTLAARDLKVLAAPKLGARG